jgi:hypothetical protein
MQHSFKIFLKCLYTKIVNISNEAGGGARAVVYLSLGKGRVPEQKGL